MNIKYKKHSNNLTIETKIWGTYLRAILYRPEFHNVDQIPLLKYTISYFSGKYGFL